MDIPQGAPLVYVSFSAEINANTTESLISVMANCSNLQVKKVYLLLSTGGGQVMEGINLYNVLKGMPFELTTHNVGNVDSIGNVVFLAGNKRYATPNATFMFHGVGFDVKSNQRLEEKNLRELMDGVESNHKRFGNIITQHTNLSAEESASLFREAKTEDATWAINKGVIHEIRDVQLTTGCPVVALVFKR